MFKTKTETFVLQHSSVVGFFTTTAHSHRLATKYNKTLDRLFGEELLDGKMWSIEILSHGFRRTFKLTKLI